MTAVRAGIATPGADAGAVVRAAQLAERWNVDSLWVGDPRATAPNSDDTYVMVAVAGAAAVTEHLRLGAFLSARSSSPPLRIAEDIGVVDQMSGGRLSVAFTAPPDGDTRCDADIRRIVDAPAAWSMPDGRTMPVTPAPAQPAVPVAVFDARYGDPLSAHAYPGHGRGLLAAVWPDAPACPAPDDLLKLKARAAAAGAGEVVLLVDTSAPLEAAIAAFGTVVATCLRAAEHEVGILALDAARWLERCTDLHHPPE